MLSCLEQVLQKILHETEIREVFLFCLTCKQTYNIIKETHILKFFYIKQNKTEFRKLFML